MGGVLKRIASHDFKGALKLGRKFASKAEKAGAIGERLGGPNAAKAAASKWANHMYVRQQVENMSNIKPFRAQVSARNGMSVTNKGGITRAGEVPKTGRVPGRRPPSPKEINQKGASGFSHGKKLRYGAVGVGAVGVAWGLMQRNHSTDKTGYSQSRGIRNY